MRLPSLDPERLKPAEGVIIGRQIVCLDEVPSTQSVACDLGRTGAAEGTVVFAESQERGRGRRGRGWVSPRGKGLWFSVLLRPERGPELPPRIGLAAAVAVAQTTRYLTGATPEVKWPNDLLWRGRKWCGILTEGSDAPGCDPFVILGVGVNVDLDEWDLPPELRGAVTSVREMAGSVVDRHLLGSRILTNLDAYYKRLLADGFQGIRREWKAVGGMLGRWVEVRLPDGCFEGIARDLDEDGALLVEVPGQGVKRIIAGETTVRY